MTIFSDASKKAGLTPEQNDLELAAAKYFNSNGTIEWFRSWADRTIARMVETGHLIVAGDGLSSHAGIHQPDPEPGGQELDDAQCEFAPSAREPIPGSEGQFPLETQGRIASAVQEPTPGGSSLSQGETQVEAVRPVREPHSDPARQLPDETQMHSARGDRNQTARQGLRETKPEVARGESSDAAAKKSMKPSLVLPPVRRPTQEQRDAALKLGRFTPLSVFDRIKVPDGRLIGDVKYSELGGLVSQNMRWMSVFQRIRAHGSPDDAHMLLRDFIPPAKLEKIMKESGTLQMDGDTDGVLMSPEGQWSIIKRKTA